MGRKALSAQRFRGHVAAGKLVVGVSQWRSSTLWRSTTLSCSSGLRRCSSSSSNSSSCLNSTCCSSSCSSSNYLVTPQHQQVQAPQYATQQSAPQWTVQLTLPADAAPGRRYEFEAEGRALSFQVPQGNGPGMPMSVSY